METLLNEKSTHQVEVYVMNPLVKHPNADTLSTTTIGNTNFTYVCKTDDWKDKVGSLVAFIQPDSIVDINRAEFSFLKDKRVRARTIRGVVSYGLLIPAPLGSKIGDNVAEILGVTHYDPEGEREFAKSKGVKSGEEEDTTPPGVYCKYDIDNGLKWANKCFSPGEIVYISEKLEGANYRAVFANDRMFVGSRNMWKKEYTTPPKITLEDLITKIGDVEKATYIYNTKVLNHKPSRSDWWNALHPNVEKYCKENPGNTVYGEMYGQVGGFPYDTGRKASFRAFDILTPSGWLGSRDFIKTCDLYGIPRVPEIGFIPYDFDKIIQLINGNSAIGNHIKEGIVVKSENEKYVDKFGRACVKLINPAYLERN